MRSACVVRGGRFRVGGCIAVGLLASALLTGCGPASRADSSSTSSPSPSAAQTTIPLFTSTASPTPHQVTPEDLVSVAQEYDPTSGPWCGQSTPWPEQYSSCPFTEQLMQQYAAQTPLPGASPSSAGRGSYQPCNCVPPVFPATSYAPVVAGDGGTVTIEASSTFCAWTATLTIVATGGSLLISDISTMSGCF